jgi:hypothetical protein
MKSSKYEYRIVSTYDGLTKPETRPEGGEWSPCHGLSQSIVDSRADIARYILRDDHVAEVVEI